MSDDDVINIDTYKARKAEEVERAKRRTYAKALSGEKIEFWIEISSKEAELPVLVGEVWAVEKIWRALGKGLCDARRLRGDRCSVCGEHSCQQWHVGRRFLGWRKGREVLAICEKVLERSVRLRVIETGDIVYTRSYVGSTWRPFDKGVLSGLKGSRQ